MYFLLNLNHYVKSYGHLSQILAFFKMPTLQIWPCHVTQEANFKKFYFFLILHLILGKVAKFLVEKLSTSEVISQKPHRGVENTPPPSAFRAKGASNSGCMTSVCGSLCRSQVDICGGRFGSQVDVCGGGSGGLCRLGA